MQGLVVSGHIAGWIILLTLFEAAGLLLLHKYTGKGVAWRDFLPSMFAGDFLLLAWLLNANGAFWALTAAALLAAFVAHLTDLVRRWV